MSTSRPSQNVSSTSEPERTEGLRGPANWRQLTFVINTYKLTKDVDERQACSTSGSAGSWVDFTVQGKPKKKQVHKRLSNFQANLQYYLTLKWWPSRGTQLDERETT